MHCGCRSQTDVQSKVSSSVRHCRVEFARLLVEAARQLVEFALRRLISGTHLDNHCYDFVPASPVFRLLCMFAKLDIKLATTSYQV